MDQIVSEYPGQRLCVVMDNLNTHKGKMAPRVAGQKPHGDLPLHPDPCKPGQSCGMLLLDSDAKGTSAVGIEAHRRWHLRRLFLALFHHFKF
jgi:hypothetical protein